MNKKFYRTSSRLALAAGCVLVMGAPANVFATEQSLANGNIEIAQAEPNANRNAPKNLGNNRKKQKKAAEQQAESQSEPATQPVEPAAETAQDAKAARKAERQRKRAEAKAAEREAAKAAQKAERQRKRAEAKAAEREAAKAARKAERQKEREAAQAARKAERQKEREAAQAARKAERKAQREANQAAATSGEGATVQQVEEQISQQAEQEAKQPARVSKRAKKPKKQSAAAVEAQIENADKQAVAVVPDNITQQQRRRLANAEKRRRAERRERRGELIGAVAAGIAVGAILPQLGGRVAADEGDRFVVERNGELYVRKDDSFLFRDNGSRADYEQMRGGRVKETITRPNGVRVITVRDAGGYVLRRVKVFPNGDRVVLYDFRDDERVEFVDYDRQLPPLRVRRPLDEYIVSARRADRGLFYDTFQAEPVERVDDGYSLQAVRDNERLRATVSRVDLDTITFATGSAYVEQSQVWLLGDIAGAMLDVIDENPAAVFMVEGHTDAVGSDLSNLTLSDRRAETVAQILVEAYDVPPENLVTQGYGEKYLKVNTLGPSQANRRATLRNITPILYSSNN